MSNRPEHIIATVSGYTVQFDGQTWTTGDARQSARDITDRLNHALGYVPTMHRSQFTVALACAREAGLVMLITHAPNSAMVDPSWDVNEPGIMP